MVAIVVNYRALTHLLELLQKWQSTSQVIFCTIDYCVTSYS